MVLPAVAAAVVLAFKVQGSADCPAPAAVSDRMLALVAGESASEERTVLIDRAGDQVVLRLQAPDGAVLAERSFLAAGATCLELESAAAVIVAAWEAELRYAAGPGLALLPSPPPIVSLAMPPAIPRRSWSIVATAAGYASWAGNHPTAATTAELAVGRGSRWLAASALLLGIGEHRIALPPGSASWRRAGLGVGARARLARGRWWADAGLHALAAVVSVQGSGFQRDLSSMAMEPAVALTPRGGLRLRQVEIWVGGFATAWPLRRDVAASEAPAMAVLPRVELAAGLGLSLDIR